MKRGTVHRQAFSFVMGEVQLGMEKERWDFWVLMGIVIAISEVPEHFQNCKIILSKKTTFFDHNFKRCLCMCVNRSTFLNNWQICFMNLLFQKKVVILICILWVLFVFWALFVFWFLVCTTLWLTKLDLGLQLNTLFPAVFYNVFLGLLCFLLLIPTNASQESKLQIHTASLFRAVSWKGSCSLCLFA